ncbi:MAG: lipid-binding SYLF domain-containing protein [Deltaproteobacteria bacterium]|nr:lipid-binding SYLF domain-containing protein [Deltaproteobacteria bacterium]
MHEKTGLKRNAVVFLIISICLGFGTAISPAQADEKREAVQLLEKTRLMFDGVMADKNFKAFHDLLKKAEAILLVPQLLKGAFVVGVSGGSGVLLVRDKETGKWNGPAFYTIGEASWGLQIGGLASEVVMLAMTQRGVTALLSHSLKLGGDVGVAAGPIGAGAEAATANLSVDILSFSRSKGLYGGISFEGAAVAVRDGLNESFYGQKVSPTDIFIRHKAVKAEAAPLVEAVTKAAKR